ncbi:cytochrome P450 [Tanacetum coccineum]
MGRREYYIIPHNTQLKMGDFYSQQSKERENNIGDKNNQDDKGWTWVIGKRNRHLKVEQYINKEEHKTLTYYFTNFPSNWDHVIMKEIFAKYGSVEDVFIARKLNKQATNTNNIILDEGFDDFSIKYLGGMSLLLQLADHNTALKILSNSTLSSHFKSLKP